jgi:hypothetical protein
MASMEEAAADEANEKLGEAVANAISQLSDEIKSLDKLSNGSNNKTWSLSVTSSNSVTWFFDINLYFNGPARDALVMEIVNAKVAENIAVDGAKEAIKQTILKKYEIPIMHGDLANTMNKGDFNNMAGFGFEELTSLRVLKEAL